MLLVVTLANLVIQTARTDGSQDGSTVVQAGANATNAAAGGAASSSEPLADLGVTPSTDAPASPSVPDLQPDPRLAKPMDQDPAASQAGRK